METRINNGEKIEDFANETSHEADIEGITGFMHSISVKILCLCWEHGEELKEWYDNK